MPRQKGYNDTRPANWPEDGLTWEQLTRSLLEHVEVEGVMFFNGRPAKFRGKVTSIGSKTGAPKKFFVNGETTDGIPVFGHWWSE